MRQFKRGVYVLLNDDDGSSFTGDLLRQMPIKSCTIKGANSSNGSSSNMSCGSRTSAARNRQHLLLAAG